MSINLSNIELPSSHEIQIAIDRAKCQPRIGGFAEFVKMAWHVLEPSTKLVWGKVMDVVCAELESIILHQTFQPRLLINIPPGTSKSMLTSVLFPAWIWTFKPTHSITGVSHEQGLAIRDARKMRLLIESEWYQERWPLKMAGDANAKTFFENEHKGFRQAVPFRSMTGRRSDLVLVDDPHSAESANSAAERDEAARIFRETLPTRVNNDDSAIIVIMQRLHQADVSGIILEDEDHFGYDTVILPMRYEKDRGCAVDWRTEEGELLFPERFPEKSVQSLEKMLMEYGAASQLQQRPVPRDGGMFKREWFEDKFMSAMPNDVVWCRGYDLAAGTKKTNDPTASCKIGITSDNKVIIAHVNNERLSPNAVRSLVKTNAEMDGTHVRISIPRDPGQASFTQVEQFRQDLMGYDVRFSPETGDKSVRASPLAAQAEAGGVYLVKGEWNAEFLDQLCNFPNAKHDDMVDAASRAFAGALEMQRKPKPKVSVFGGRILR